MTYREPDPHRVAETEAKLAADEEIERRAAAGRDARVQREHGIEKRLLREKRPGAARVLAIWGSSFAAYMAMIVAAGATVPAALSVGIGAGAAGFLGSTVAAKVRRKRELAWADSHPFQVLGYVELLESPLIVTALTVHIELTSIEPEDRERVIDLLGTLDTVDPVVRLDGTTIVIEMLMAGTVKTFARALIDKVVMPLHEARRVHAVHLTPSTADPSAPYDAYR